MDCQRSNELMSLAIDQMISEEELEELNAHVDTCQSCKEEYELLQSIQSSLALIATEEVELPSGFHSDLMKRVASEDGMAMPLTSEEKVIPLWQRVNRRHLNVAAMMVLVVIFALIGINNLDRLRNDGMMMESTTTSDQANMPMVTSESVEAELTMEMAEEAFTQEAMPKEETALADQSSEMDDQVALDETVVESATMMVEEAGDLPEPEAASLETSEEEEVDMDSPMLAEIAEETELAATEEPSNTQGGAEDQVKAEHPLARDTSDYEKSPRSVENNMEYNEQTGTNLEVMPKGLGVMIIGGFIALNLLAALVILKKLK